MTTRRLWIIPVAFALLMACTSCRVRSISFSVDDHDHAHVKRVYVPSHHVCGRHCHDHYWDGGGVVVLRGHRHGPGCGHYWDGSHWSIRRGRVERVHPRHRHGRGVVEVHHTHGPSCGCVYHPRHRRWIEVRRGHRHGPGCGHVYLNGRWTIRF